MGSNYLFEAATEDVKWVTTELASILDLTLTIETETPQEFNTIVGNGIKKHTDELYLLRPWIFVALLTMDSLRKLRGVSMEWLQPAQQIYDDFLHARGQMTWMCLNTRLVQTYHIFPIDLGLRLDHEVGTSSSSSAVDKAKQSLKREPGYEAL